MRHSLSLLIILMALLLGSCGQPKEAVLYNPGGDPLTGDELASLLGMYHWKFTKTPGDGKPYWGVRLIAANQGLPFERLPVPPFKILGTGGGALHFAEPVASDGNPQILLGLQVENGNIHGILSTATPGKGSYSTKVHFDQDLVPEGGYNVHNGSYSRQNRASLIEFYDKDFRTTVVICLEFFA